MIMDAGAGAAGRFNIAIVIASGIAINTLFTLVVVPAMYVLFARDFSLGVAADDVEDAIDNG